MRSELRSTLRNVLVTVLAICAVFASTAGSQIKALTSRVQRPATIHSLPRITTRSEFDQLSRIYYRGRFYALPHVMFVIDRQDKDRIYYINSKLYQFHKDFVNGTYLSLERGLAFYQDNYLNANRRFLLGTVAFQSAANKFTFEFWEGDQLNAALIEETYSKLAATFYAPVYFKPNSDYQQKTAEEVSATADKQSPTGSSFKILTAAKLSEDIAYQPLNLATGIGQLRILDHVSADTVIDKNQIIIFRVPPVHVTPLSGIITTEPASPLSHTNMLAKSWRIPNAFIKNADKLFKSLEGKYVRLEVTEDGYNLTPADPRDVEARQRQWIKRADLITPPADLKYTALDGLDEQRAADANRFGAKSANLGELIHSRTEGVDVPPGFTIPFHYYQQFISDNELDDRIRSAVDEDKFVHDPAFRKKKLQEIRSWITAGAMDKALKTAVLAKAHKEFPGEGLFARSSTNAEDLPNFSGAGLYTTVPNVRTDEQIIDAIKTVWASVWNYEAYEARESFGMNHFGVYMAVLLQRGINADSAGVAITADPFNTPESDESADAGPFVGLPQKERSELAVGAHSVTASNAVYINAKRGLGMKVVEGKKVAEQVIYRPATGSVQVLTRSAEDSMLKFDEHGGLRQIPIPPERVVLSDDMVKRLADAALEIKKVFHGRDQDIEWVYSSGKLYIVQSRPYVEGK